MSEYPRYSLQLAGLVAIVIMTACGQVEANLIKAKGVSFGDVSSAVASAHEGDTVLVPAGSASWTSTLTVAKGITLQGSGSDTVVLDDVPRNQSRGQQPKVGQQAGSRKRQAQPESLFIKAGPLKAQRNAGGGSGVIIRIKLTPRQSFRLTGFTFRYGSVVTAQNQHGAIGISGRCPSVRVDNCHFDQLYVTTNIFFDGWLYGVVDHCIFDIRPRGGGASVRVYHTNWGDQPSGGWGSWADPPYFGSEKFIFVEDNVINNLGPAPERGNIDGQHGGRFVIRHNTFNNCNIFYHGSDNGTAAPFYNRGTRAVEIYNNAFISSGQRVPAGQDRSGPLIWHDNTYTGNYGGGMMLASYRQSEYETKGFFGGDGTSPWDYNATEPDGTHVDGHSPYTYATGTHTGGNDSTTITVTGTPWKTNQWAGYTATNTNPRSRYYHGFNWIASNTSNTLILNDAAVNPPHGKFDAGDTFAIHKVLIIIDQPGRGKGDLIVGNPSGSTNLNGTNWPKWPNQVIEPCYSWNNTLNGQNLDFKYNEANKLLKENVDFYNNTPMPGYKPYIYPHPLTVASGNP
jgi:hypothetical protein